MNVYKIPFVHFMCSVKEKLLDTIYQKYIIKKAGCSLHKRNTWKILRKIKGQYNIEKTFVILYLGSFEEILKW